METGDERTLSVSNQTNIIVNSVKETQTVLLLNVNELEMEYEYDDCEPDKVYIQQTFISENDIKQEPCSTSDKIENNIVRLPELVKCGICIKQEEALVTNNSESSSVDDKVIIQETAFINHIKEELNETEDNLCCGNCNEEYKFYCTNCSMLIRILDNCVENDSENNAKNTLPKDILDIRQAFMDVGIYTLRAIPEGAIFGPFEGLNPVPSTTGSAWRLKGGKLVYPENCENLNWMRFVNYAAHSSNQNLLAFQHQNRLYYRGTRRMKEGEELLVYFCEESGNFEDANSETYFQPTVMKEFKNVYACTYCCIGYNSEENLLKHKSKCCSGIEMRYPIEEIVQCSLCKMYLEKREHSEYHVKYCWEKNSSHYHPISMADEEEGKSHPATSSSRRPVECSKCTYDGPCRRHKKNRRFIARRSQCDLCDEMFGQATDLEEHLRLAHPPRKSDKPFKCTRCAYETCYKTALDKHLRAHDDIKKFECETCKKKFRLNSTLKRHLIYFHAEVRLVRQAKKFKCKKCPYETDIKKCIVKHYNTHSEDKPFNCQVCLRAFTSLSSLQSHMKHIHPPEKKRYRCHVCGYETNDKSRLKQHFRIHEDRLKFKCDLCDREFNQKSNLKVHIKTVHGDNKEYKCSKCSYETNRKDSYIKHKLTHDSGIRFTCKICNLGFACRADMKIHDQECHSTSEDARESLANNEKIENIRKFQCKMCPKRFQQKGSLIKHIRDSHEEKMIKCSIPHCSYKTSRRDNLRRHLSVHDKLQKFDCQICKVGFANEEHFNIHTKRKHPTVKSEVDVKETIV